MNIIIHYTLSCKTCCNSSFSLFSSSSHNFCVNTENCECNLPFSSVTYGRCRVQCILVMHALPHSHHDARFDISSKWLYRVIPFLNCMWVVWLSPLKLACFRGTACWQPLLPVRTRLSTVATRWLRLPARRSWSPSRSSLPIPSVANHTSLSPNPVSFIRTTYKESYA